MPEVGRETPGNLLGDCCGDSTPRDHHNQMRILRYMATWAVLFVGATFVVKRGLLPAGPLPWILAALPVALGVFVILAYSRYLREADELNRVIQLNALAVGFGGTWLAVTGYQVFQQLGAPEVGASHFVLVMAVLYTIGVLAGRRQYR
jgi:hypothetical protein